MRSFACTNCTNIVYFENTSCLKCNHPVGFHETSMSMVTLEKDPSAPGLFRICKSRDKSVMRYCSNAPQGACNWLTPSDDPNTLCLACDLNRTIPNLSEFGNLKAWTDLERAKKRLVYSLLRFELPLDTRPKPPGRLTFDFAHNAKTGHLDGVISIDLRETDAVERERQRQYFGESYRTLLGHLRHESGHFYWSMLVGGAGRLDAFRALFGDENTSYADAMDRHHAQGAPANWQTQYVSAYATAHPWEDWAETWAHYLHMTAAVDTAESAGMEPRAAGIIFGSIWPFKKSDIYREATFEGLMDRWIPLTIAMNRMSRSMGHGDFYPFVIPAAAYDKLAFIHEAIRNAPRKL